MSGKTDRRVDGITAEVEHILPVTDQPCEHRSELDADANLPSRFDLARRDHHFESAAQCREQRIRDMREETSRGHDCVPDGLDLFQVMPPHDLLIGADQVLKIAQYLLRGVFFTIACEIDNITE